MRLPHVACGRSSAPAHSTVCDEFAATATARSSNKNKRIFRGGLPLKEIVKVRSLQDSLGAPWRVLRLR